MRTTCMARDTGFSIILGTALKESRHGPFSSGGCCIGGIGAVAGGGPPGAACATAGVKEVSRKAKERIMHAVFA
jgi:hypothetical protein